MANPFVLATFGQMHAGKTYNLEELISKTNRTKIVYNFGREEDWQGYQPIELQEEKGKLYFIHEKKRFLFERSFMKKFRGKKVKIATVFHSKTLALFYTEIARMNSSINYVFFIIDDATAVFDTNLTKLEKSFISRCKHSDVRVALASHDLHYFPRQAWGLLTHVRLFRTINPPPIAKRDVIPCFDALMDAWEKLQEAPQYSYYTLDVYNKELTYTEFKNKSLS